jgi:pimeloyl-ACP methyl ester carboxylesterase
MAPMRATAVRHSMAGYGMLAPEFDADQTRAWVEPALSDAGVRRDTAAFAREADPGDLLDVATRLGRFERPVLLVWGNGDRFFKVDFARRLRDVFADARLVEIEDGQAFMPIQHPGRLAEEIATFTPVTA